MSAMDRMTRGLGTVGYGILVVLLAVVSWRLLRGERPRDGVLLALLLGILIWERLTPLVLRGPPTPVSRFVGGTLAALAWSGLATLLAFPEVVLSGDPISTELRWMRSIVLVVVGSPALALLHLGLSRDGTVASRDEWRLRLARLGPLAVVGYVARRLSGAGDSNGSAA